MSSQPMYHEGPWGLDELKSECKYQCRVLLCGECSYRPVRHSPRLSFFHIEIYVSGNKLGMWCGNDKIYLCPSATPIDSAIYREDVVSWCPGHHGHQSSTCGLNLLYFHPQCPCVSLFQNILLTTVPLQLILTSDNAISQSTLLFDIHPWQSCRNLRISFYVLKLFCIFLWLH